MCTALQLDGFFGRTLDVEQGYGERVCITPRQYPFHWRCGGELTDHYALIGMAVEAGGYPLYFDAANEVGLAMAGLNFPDSACYLPVSQEETNIGSFELIPYVLSQCATVAQARELLQGIRVVAVPFSPAMPPAPLHWIIADGQGSIVVEPLAEGLAVYDNPYGVMTNNPPWSMMQFQPRIYSGLSNQNPPTGGYTCFGLGGVGLPGDLSPVSRLVRIEYHRRFAEPVADELAGVGRHFHLLSTVTMPQGSCMVPAGRLEYTRYISCLSLNSGRYYYTTHNNRQISCVDMHRTVLDGSALMLVATVEKQQVNYQN